MCGRARLRYEVCTMLPRSPTREYDSLLTTLPTTYYLLPTTYYASTVVSCSVSISETIRFTSSFVSRTARSFWAAYLSVASVPRVGR